MIQRRSSICHMPETSHIHVRPLEIGDFAFVQDVASKRPDFTVPPVYVLWLMLRIKGAICLIAEQSSEGPIAYLLAVPVNGPGDSIFIWQLAASDCKDADKATLAVLTEFREIVFSLPLDNILFSSIPNSSVYRLIRRYAWKLASLVPERLNALPPAVNDSESEFLLKLKSVRRSGKTQILGDHRSQM